MTVFAGLSALASAYISGYVLEQLGNTDSMAMIITDAGLKSDSKALEHNMSAASRALFMVRDMGWALSVGCLGVAGSVLLRIMRNKRV